MCWPGGGLGGATAEPHPILNESLAAIPKADGIDTQESLGINMLSDTALPQPESRKT
jgi:hypothetical protein